MAVQKLLPIDSCKECKHQDDFRCYYIRGGFLPIIWVKPKKRKAFKTHSDKIPSWCDLEDAKG